MERMINLSIPESVFNDNADVIALYVRCVQLIAINNNAPFTKNQLLALWNSDRQAFDTAFNRLLEMGFLKPYRVGVNYIFTGEEI